MESAISIEAEGRQVIRQDVGSKAQPGMRAPEGS
jgi:hypothetical protein